MIKARLFMNGQSQAVRLPKEFRFEGDEVCIKKVGDLVLLYQKEKEWEIFMDGVSSFTSDYAVERSNELPEDRAEL